MLGRTIEEDADAFFSCFYGLLAGYGLYFNYPTIKPGITAKFRLLRGLSRDDKSPQDGREENLKETKLARKYLGGRDVAEYTYEFLGPTRYISDHHIYRILTPVYAAVFTVLVILLYYYYPPGSDRPGDPLKELLLVSIMVSGLVGYLSIPRFANLKERDYPYYLAKSYFVLSELQTELSVKIRYLVDGMEVYNLFLQRNLKLKIKNLQRIYSLLSGDEVKIQQDIIKKICSSFHKEKDLDKLEPYRRIKNVMQENYKMEIETGVSKRRTLQEWIPLLALVTSSVIALFQIFMK